MCWWNAPVGGQHIAVARKWLVSRQWESEVVMARTPARWPGRKDSRGATLVEFALVLPILLVLLFGVIEVGRMVTIYTSTMTAAREGARYGTAVGTADSGSVARYLDCSGIRDAARSKVIFTTLADEDIHITFDKGPEQAPYADCQADGGLPDPSALTVTSGDRIVVQVSTTFQSPVPLISNLISGRTIESTQSRTIFKGGSGG